jgi:hypothetical protein
MSAMQGVPMKKILQPLAWYLVLTSVLALASGVALSFATDTALTTSGTSAHLAKPVQH